LVERRLPSANVEELVKNGHGEKWLQTRRIPVYEDGKPVYLVGISQDITEQKRQQEAILQLNRELEAFSYSVSHDLRAPLRAVTGYAQILDEDYASILDSEGKRLLRTISDNAEKMGHLIDNLLTFSRLGRKELSKRETDMNELVNRALGEIGKSTEVSATLHIGQLHKTSSDPELMTQVLINLIENAIKYSSKKEKPEIEITSYVDGNDVVYCVTDNGAGFDMRYYDKLFGVFQRLHAADEYDGTGVGLAIVQRIVNRHGGRVWAKGKVGEGATFCFALPIPNSK
jgi:light-regulated signal transduction histidine kinase (bacteriophytochrome)